MDQCRPQVKGKEPPTVVRIRRKGGEVVQDCDVYIGRAMTMGGWRLRQSAWANPFNVKRDCGGDRDLACKKYETYLRDTEEGQRLVARLDELTGKRLGCWCAPNACHGDVLVRLWHECVGNASSGSKTE